MIDTDLNLQNYLLGTIRRGGCGPESAISADRLAREASVFLRSSIDNRTIRATIHDLRLSGQPICSGPTGFFWPSSLNDVLVCADLEFRGEARSMLYTARKLREAGRSMFGQQLNLF